MQPQATTVYITVLIAGIIFFFIVIVFLVTIVTNHRKSVTTYLGRLQAELKLSEREKVRLGYDIHDEVNSKLSGVKMMIDDFVPPDNETQELLHKASGSLSSLIVGVRRLSNSLVPYSLEKDGLFVSLDELIHSLFISSSVQVYTEYKIRESEIREKDKIHLYRIIQEMLGNVIRHANAHHVIIAFTRQSKFAIIKISDDGTGFDEEYIKRTPKGIGLKNITARVKAMDGEIYLKTGKGKGTIWIIKLPVVQQFIR